MPIFNLSELLYKLKTSELHEFTASDFKKIATIESGNPLKLDSRLITMAALNNGQLACLTENSLQIMDVNTGACLKNFDSIQGGVFNPTNTGPEANVVLGLQVLPGGNQLMIRRTQNSTIVDLETGTVVLNVPRYPHLITDGHLAFEFLDTLFFRKGSEITYPELNDYRYYASIQAPVNFSEERAQRQKNLEYEILKYKGELIKAESECTIKRDEYKRVEERCESERELIIKEHKLLHEKLTQKRKEVENHIQFQVCNTLSYLSPSERGKFMREYSDKDLESYEKSYKEAVEVGNKWRSNIDIQKNNAMAALSKAHNSVEQIRRDLAELERQLNTLKQEGQVENEWWERSSSVGTIHLGFKVLNEADLLPLIAGMITYPNVIKKLDLSGVKLSDKGFNEILTLLQNNAQLKELNLQDTEVSVEQAEAIFTAWRSQKLPISGLLFSSPIIKKLRAIPIIFNPDSHFFSAFIPVPSPAVVKLDEEPEGVRCFLTKQIMFEPVVASDGYTYEKEAIENYMAINKNSPQTQKPFPHVFLSPNNHISSQIQSFFKEHPEARAQIYLPQQFCRELQDVCMNVNETALFSVLELDRRLLFKPILDPGKRLLLEVLCEQETGWLLLPQVIDRFEPSEIHAILRICPLERWLFLLAQKSLDYKNDKPALYFLGFLEKTVQQLIPPVDLALYALQREDDALFQLAASQIKDINQVVDDQGNTLLHLAASQGRKALVTYLLEKGADLKRPNFDGKKSKVLAQEMSHKEIVTTIELAKLTPALHKFGIIEQFAKCNELIEQLQEEVRVLKEGKQPSPHSK